MGRSVFSVWTKFVVVLFSTILIAACGGGSGGGGEPAASSNSGNGNNGNNGSGQQVDFSAQSDAEITALANASLMFGELTKDRPGIQINGQPVVSACNNSGGTQDSPSNPLGFGDYTFNNCEIVAGVFLDGLVNRSVSSVTTFDVQQSFTDFISDDRNNNEKATINGTYYSSTNFSATEVTGTFSTNGGILTIDFVSPAYSDTVGLENVDTAYADDFNNGVVRYDFSYTVSSTFFAGSVSVNTTTTVEYYYNLDGYPRAGVAVIRGLNGGSIRVTALGDGSPTGLVRIETDADGDGTYESSRDITWTQFDS